MTKIGNKQETILGSILEDEYFLVPELIKTEWKDDKTEIINGLFNGFVTQEYSQNFNYSTDEIPRGILHQDMNYLLQLYGDRNIYIGSTTSAQLYYKKNAQTYNMEFNKFYDIFSKIHNGISNFNYKPYLNKYLNVLPYFKTHENFTEYNCENKISKNDWDKLFESHSINDFIPKLIDREIENTLKNPTKNIEFLESKLDYNNEIGFYCYNSIPLLCLHDFMLAQGRSLRSINERCSNSKGVCRYCGGELVIEVETTKLDLSKIAYKIIYSLVEMLNLGIYQESLENLIKSSVQISVEKLELDELEDNELKINAFIATFVYKLFKDIQKDLSIRNSSKFTLLIKDSWSKAGWDNSIVESLMNNEERFYEYSHILEMILKFHDNVNEIDEINSISYLFLHGMKDDGNPFQKIYMKDKSKLGEMVDMMLKVLGNTSSIDDYKNIIEKSQNSKLNEIFNSLDIKNDSGLKSFFSMWWEYICPVHYIHEFENNKCKYCQIIKNNSDSIDKTFEKYQSNLEKILNPIIEKSFHQNSSYRQNIIKLIENQPEQIPKLLNIDFYLKDEFNEILHKKLCDLIHIGEIKEFPPSKKNNIKLLWYLINEANIKQEIIENELFDISTKLNPKLGQIIMIF